MTTADRDIARWHEAGIIDAPTADRIRQFERLGAQKKELAWAITRHWAQGALTALLAPAWVVSEWLERTEHHGRNWPVALAGLAVLAIVYFAALPESGTSLRRALKWIGGLALLPLMLALTISTFEPYWTGQSRSGPRITLAVPFAFINVP